MYASKSGNTLAIAETLRDSLISKKFTVKFGKMDDFESLGFGNKDSYYILMTSTVDYG